LGVDGKQAINSEVIDEEMEEEGLQRGNINVGRKQRNESELLPKLDDEDREIGGVAAGGSGGNNNKPEVLNSRAVAVITRVSNKLTGKDFRPTNTLVRYFYN
jgi:FKBP12-rapamycin complex-associated protein